MNAAAINPRIVDLPDPVVAAPGERRLLLEPAHRVRDRGAVRRLHLLGDLAGRRPPTASTRT